MFPSLSKCAPGTTVSSEFTAEFDFTLDISSDTDVRVNGAGISSRPISIRSGDIVAATVTVPDEFLAHVAVPYTIDGINSSFVAVTKSEHYVVFKYETADTRWWQFTPSSAHAISYRDDLGYTSVIRELGYNTIPVLDEYVGIPDPLTSTVYFYNNQGVLIENLMMPAPPVQCIKFISEQDNFFIVSCTDGYIYRVNVNLEILQQQYLQGGEPIGRTLVSPEWLFELSFETDVPFKGAFTRANHFIIDEDAPQPKYVSCTDQHIWVGGASKVWKLDSSFQIIEEFNLDGLCVGIQALQDSAIVTTKYGTVEVISSDQENVALYYGGWLSNPVIYGDSVVVADSASSKLIFFDSVTFAKTEIPLGDFASSYISVTDESIFIAGHDTNIVKKYDGSEITSFDFADKVTWVQPLGNGLIASHFLRDSIILQHADQQTVIPFQLAPITSGLTITGSIPQRIISLVENDIYALVPEGVTYWSDGKVNGPINTGSIFSAAVKIENEGIHRFPLLLGDVALDLQVTGAAQTFIPRDTGVPLLQIKNGRAQHDFFIPENYEPCRASIDYGYLLKNFNPYTGELLNPGDVLSICVPFGTSSAPIVSVFTLGAARFYIGVNPDTQQLTAHSLNSALLNSGSLLTHTVDTAGEYYFPTSWPELQTVGMHLSGRNLLNLGASFDSAHPVSVLADFASPEDEDVYARVPSSSGVFDIYFDAGSPQILDAYEIMPRWGDLQITVMVDDENGIPQPVQQTIQTALETPVNFKIVASADAVSWTDIATFSDVSQSDWQQNEYRQFQFANSLAYRYWRFQNTTTQGTGVSVSRWKIRGKRPELDIKINGNAAPGGINYLGVGDVITADIGNSPRIFDSRGIKITGVKNIDFTTTTSSFKGIDYLDLGVLVQPYVRQVYESAPQAITGISDSVTIAANDSSLQFKVVDGGDFSSEVTVEDGDQLIVRKTIRNLFEPTAVICQLQTDPQFGDEVLVDVGSLQITNMEMTGEVVRDGFLNPIFLSPVDNIRDSSLEGIELSSFAEQADSSAPIEITDTISYGTVSNNFYASDKFLAWLKFNNAYAILNRIGHEKQAAVDYYAASPLVPGASTVSFYAIDRLGASKQLGLNDVFVDYLEIEKNAVVNDSTDLAAAQYEIFNTNNFYERPAIVAAEEAAYNSYGQPIFDLEKYKDNFSSIQAYDRLSTRPELVFYEIGSFDKIGLHFTSLENTVYSSYVHINNAESINSFIAAIESAGAEVTDSFKVYVIQHASIISDRHTALDGTGAPSVLNSFSLIINSENIIDILTEEIKNEMNMYVLDKAEPLNINDVIWTTDDINNYGAFDTEQAAADAAVVAGHDPIIVLPITGTDSFTYRKLSDLSRVCAIGDGSSVYALARLIQGG